MNSVVIYGSRHGNTRKVAETIAGELRKHGAVEVYAAEAAPATLPEQVALVVVGGPTEGHRMSVPVAQLFDRLSNGTLAGKAAAAFDTRVRLPEWLSGSAAAGIAKRLKHEGARLMAPEISFLVSGNLPVLEPGEVERAAAWASLLAAKAESQTAVAAGQ